MKRCWLRKMIKKIDLVWSVLLIETLNKVNNILWCEINSILYSEINRLVKENMEIQREILNKIMTNRIISTNVDRKND